MHLFVCPHLFVIEVDTMPVSVALYNIQEKKHLIYKKYTLFTELRHLKQIKIGICDRSTKNWCPVSSAHNVSGSWARNQVSLCIQKEHTMASAKFASFGWVINSKLTIFNEDSINWIFSRFIFQITKIGIRSPNWSNWKWNSLSNSTMNLAAPLKQYIVHAWFHCT